MDAVQQSYAKKNTYGCTTSTSTENRTWIFYGQKSSKLGIEKYIYFQTLKSRIIKCLCLLNYFNACESQNS